jgi:hypothetical protein
VARPPIRVDEDTGPLQDSNLEPRDYETLNKIKPKAHEGFANDHVMSTESRNQPSHSVAKNCEESQYF